VVIGLARDQVNPAEHACALHHAISGSAYAEVDSGHLVVFERPEELALTIRRFLTMV